MSTQTPPNSPIAQSLEIPKLKRVEYNSDDSDSDDDDDEITYFECLMAKNSIPISTQIPIPAK